MVEPGRKQVHLRGVPLGTNLLKDLRVEGPLRLDGLAQARQFVRYDIQSPWNVSGLETYLIVGAPGQNPPQEGT